MDTIISGTHNDSRGQYIAGWWCRNTGKTVSPPYSAMGLIRDGKCIGQAIFCDYTGSNIEIHFHAPGCFTRRTIKELYSYVFLQLKCNRLTAKIEKDNKKLLYLMPRLGFVYEYTQKAYYGTSDNPIDACVYKLTKEIALKRLKWLLPHHRRLPRVLQT